MCVWLRDISYEVCTKNIPYKVHWTEISEFNTASPAVNKYPPSSVHKPSSEVLAARAVEKASVARTTTINSETLRAIPAVTMPSRVRHREIHLPELCACRCQLGRFIRITFITSMSIGKRSGRPRPDHSEDYFAAQPLDSRAEDAGDGSQRFRRLRLRPGGETTNSCVTSSAA